ncbi:ABC transporter ATP-binding protein [Beijerinckia indica]|uniref:ABC transporter related n=1 Tax=Beijerinckia indica subsp. indica (strain ATCC 9039 / DSM 1715 / NCIMB 8712) TaxID=395963 RepID=B2IFC2_BEII9|nr:dipeptide ABC transporter ATP-binding protein [Beijerinckia indica]ACB97022.1 ABC transporter related [Beijerinckia indica subsp. indica ATCC 9039]
MTAVMAPATASGQTDKPLLAFRDLSISYGGQAIVRDLTLSLHPGETAALVGESGSGKSQTALAALRLLPEPAKVSGQILFEGQDLLSLSELALNRLRGRRIALIFQEPMSALDPLFPVGAQIGVILRHHLGLSRRAALTRACELLDQVGIPDPQRRVKAYPHELSGGQRQRVAIAMAIACEPAVLIADEPTTALDVTLAARILDLIEDLKQRLGMALLFISHDLGLVRRIADSVHVMHQGRIVESGPAREIIHHPREAYTRLLLGAAPRPRLRPHPLEAKNLLEARDLTVRFKRRGTLGLPSFGLFRPREKDFTAVDHVNLTLRQGETFGLVGESGSGKSTLARALLRLVPASGSILFEGRDLVALQPRALRPFRHAMQIVFQDPYQALSPRMRIGAIITEGLRIHEPGLNAQALDARAAFALQEVKLDPALRHRFPAECSGGQRQRIAIARAMILRPKLLLLDEPTSALDRSVQAEILELLSLLQASHGLTYLFISHDFGAVRAMADTIGVMRMGHLVESGPAEEILTRPRMDYTSELIAAAFPAES